MTLLRSERQRAIARTVRQLNARHVGRAFAVPAFANFNSPAALPFPSPAGRCGEGEAGRTMLAVSPECFLNLHEVQ